MAADSSNSVNVFLDTMIYLHFADIKDIDFPNVLGCDSVTIVVPRITTRELDAKKNDHKSKRVRQRARTSLKKIEKCARGPVPIRDSVNLALMKDAPAIDFEQHGLVREWQDDHLIAAALAYGNDNAGRTVVISDDTGVRIMAAELDVEALELPEKYRLPDEPDAPGREIAKLKREIQQIQHSRPKLDVVFASNNAATETYLVQHPLPLDEELIEVEVASAKENIEEYRAEQLTRVEEKMVKIKDTWDLVDHISQSEIKRFEEECRTYPHKLRHHLKYLHACSNMSRRKFFFVIEIYNIGTAPANDVSLRIHFPDGFQLQESGGESLPEPTWPKPPSSNLSPPSSRLELSSLMIPNRTLSVRDPLSRFSLERRANGYDLQDRYSSIKHGEFEALRELFVFFDTPETARSFNCEYTLNVANLPEPVTGKLNFIIEHRGN